MSPLMGGEEWTGKSVLEGGIRQVYLEGNTWNRCFKASKVSGSEVCFGGRVETWSCRSLRTCTPWCDCCRYHALCASQSDLTALNMDLPPPRNYVPLGLDCPKPTSKTPVKSVSTPTSIPQHGPPQAIKQDLGQVRQHPHLHPSTWTAPAHSQGLPEYPHPLNMDCPSPQPRPP